MSPAGDAEFIVRFDKVQKSFDGRTRVVRDLDLEVRRGEFLTLLGPSGSGKTTTLMMLAGFEIPSDGRILLDGKPIDDLPPFRRGIGVVFQNYALFPHMTVAENVAFALSVRRRPKAEIVDRVERALAMVQLGGFASRRPAQLSGGQQQRVALARALVFDPKLVLLDEPLGALDKQLREQLQYELKRLHEMLGVTMVYVTHDQGEALTMSDRIAVFHDGAVQQLAAPRVLYDEPANAFVAGFIGESNMIAGRLVAHDGAAGIVEADGGRRWRGRLVDELRIGDSAVLSLRPERVRLAAGGARGRDEDHASATIRDLIFLGDHLRAIVDIGGQALIAKIADPAQAAAWRRGASVDLGWTIADARIYRAR